ncbi:MAG: MFS transporter [Planctomycetes bacterium]|nr:MFS transporter [Planctomycetota bacterium]
MNPKAAPGDATRKRWTLIAAVLGSGIGFLDSTIVNVAMPRIGRELPTGLANVLEAQSYVYYGYLLTLSALFILAGALGDYYGRRRMFVFGMVAFGVTSVLCGLATTMEALIAFRVLQGAAGAFLVLGSPASSRPLMSSTCCPICSSCAKSLVTSDPIMGRSSWPRLCRNGSPRSAPRPPTSRQAAPGRTATSRASTNACVMNF